MIVLTNTLPLLVRLTSPASAPVPPLPPSPPAIARPSVLAGPGAGIDRRRDAEAAKTTAAADGLDQYAVRFRAIDRHLAVLRDGHVSGRIAGAAEAAHTEHDRRFLACLGRFYTAGNVNSAGPAAAADRLSEQPRRAVTEANRSASTMPMTSRPRPPSPPKPPTPMTSWPKMEIPPETLIPALAAAAADRLDRDRDLVVANALNLDAVGRARRRADRRSHVASIAAASHRTRRRRAPRRVTCCRSIR